MPLVLAASGSEILLVALVAVIYAGVLWMIFDIVTRPDFTGWMKILWIVFGLVFSIATLLVYVVWVRRRDYSRR